MQLEKPVLLIDQDDVLAEYIKGVTESFNRTYGTHYHYQDCDRWDLTQIFGEDIVKVMHKPELFRHLEPVKDAIEVFERLYHSNLFEMYIVTAATPHTVGAKWEWIEEHLPFFPQNRFITCSAKFMIKGDYLLDDGMHNIEPFAKAGGEAIVFNRPHNAKAGKEFKRVYGWAEFEEWILEAYAGNSVDALAFEERVV
jgi:5'(3')-deoxyribonucleotidase